MLRTIRLTAAIVCFTLITLLFLDFTGTLHTWFGWLAKIQFLPAVLALNIGVVLFLIVLTLLFGRIYCSVICPLGVFQDAVSWFSGKQKKNRFRYSPALKWLRYGVLAVFILALVAGLNALSFYWHLTVHTAGWFPVCWLRYGNGEIISWHILPNGQKAMLSMKWMSG